MKALLLVILSSLGRLGIAKTTQLTAVESQSKPSKINLVNTRNVRYAALIDIHGVEVPLSIDTGSTDTWINPPKMPVYLWTNTHVSITYGNGSYGVEGNVGMAPFSIGDYVIPEQAFVAATISTVSHLVNNGIYGALALGSKSMSSIHSSFVRKDPQQAELGYPFLENLFRQYSTLPRFVAVDLSRNCKAWDSNGGTLHFGQYDPLYAYVAYAPKLDVFPGTDRWRVLMDGFLVDGVKVPLQSGHDGTPPGRAVTMLDTGAIYSELSAAISREYHSKLGGVQAPNGMWIVPCDSPAVVVQLGGQFFPIHPVDTTSDHLMVKLPDGRHVGFCWSSFKDTARYDDNRYNGYDIVLGIGFLRNVYSVFNLGESYDPAFVQLVSKTEPTAKTGRGRNPYSEIPPWKLLAQVADPQDLYKASPLSGGCLFGQIRDEFDALVI